MAHQFGEEKAGASIYTHQLCCKQCPGEMRGELDIFSIPPSAANLECFGRTLYESSEKCISKAGSKRLSLITHEFGMTRHGKLATSAEAGAIGPILDATCTAHQIMREKESGNGAFLRNWGI